MEAYNLALQSSGHVTITNRATGATTTLAMPTVKCSAPFDLSLLRNGLLVLRDSTGRILWNNGAACMGNTSCYSVRMHDTGQLVVQDGSGAAVWRSNSSSSFSGSTANSSGLLQLVGNSTRSCIYSGPTFPATWLTSPSKRYQLRIIQQSGALQLLDTTSSSLFLAQRLDHMGNGDRTTRLATVGRY